MPPLGGITRMQRNGNQVPAGGRGPHMHKPEWLLDSFIREVMVSRKSSYSCSLSRKLPFSRSAVPVMAPSCTDQWAGSPFHPVRRLAVEQDGPAGLGVGRHPRRGGAAGKQGEAARGASTAGHRRRLPSPAGPRLWSAHEVPPAASLAAGRPVRPARLRAQVGRSRIGVGLGVVVNLASASTSSRSPRRRRLVAEGRRDPGARRSVRWAWTPPAP